MPDEKPREKLGRAIDSFFEALKDGPFSDDKYQAALTKARIVQAYINAGRAIETLRTELARFQTTSPMGDYSLLDIYAQALDAMEVSIANHRITWEHQSGKDETS